MDMNSLSLAKVMGLRPLDRVQINSKQKISESRLLRDHSTAPDELPYYYFHRVVGEQFEVRSPGGYMDRIDPLEVCDVVPGQPVLVDAMPRSVFVNRLKLSVTERNHPAGPECYAPAYVLHATKNRWGQVEVGVWFVDDALNDANIWTAPLARDERNRIESLVRRTVMPVLSRASASYSADHGLAHAEKFAARISSLLITAGLGGDTVAVAKLAASGTGRLSKANVNQLHGRIGGRRLAV